MTPAGPGSNVRRFTQGFAMPPCGLFPDLVDDEAWLMQAGLLQPESPCRPIGAGAPARIELMAQQLTQALATLPAVDARALRL